MSSDTLSRQVPINGTISYVVPPGSETNYYYIPISNLPFQTSWQQLKDHVRTVCSSVERVEIFGGSTSGWVCVKGRDNFDAAMSLFGNGTFNGRCIFADGRNATQQTLIKDVEGSHHHSSRPLTHYSPSSSSMMLPTGSEFTQWASTTSPTCSLSSTGEYQSHGPVYNYGEMFTGWSPEAAAAAAAAAGNYAEQPHYNPVAMEQYPYDASYHSAHQYQVNPNGYPYADYISTESYNTGAGVVHTTKRKIIIRHLPSWATVNQVQDLIRHKSGISADKIQQIDLPLTDGNKTNRGYATITLETEDAASRAIRKLHGYKYDSRTLTVEHTKEGVSENEGYRPRATKPHRDTREKRDKKEGPSSHHSSSTIDKKGSKSHHHKSDVIIAHGSSPAFK